MTDVLSRLLARHAIGWDEASPEVAMTVYYFHVQKGRSLILDPEGVDLRGPADALEVAAKLASSLLDDGEIACDWTHGAVRVEDQHHRRILRLPLTSVRARDSRNRAFVN